MNRMVMRFDDSDPTMTPLPRQQRAAPEFDLSAALTAVWHHKLLMLAAMLTALLLGVLYIVVTPSTYRAFVQVMIVEEIEGTTTGRPSALGQNEVMLESAQKVWNPKPLRWPWSMILTCMRLTPSSLPRNRRSRWPCGICAMRLHP